MEQTRITAVTLGEMLKKELKERGTSQKVFAEAIGLRPSHLSEIIKGKRQIPKTQLSQISAFLGLPIEILLECQMRSNIERKMEKALSQEDLIAEDMLQRYDNVICVKSLLKDLCYTDTSAKSRMDELIKEYELPSIDIISKNFGQLCNRCFRRSSKNGSNYRMIATWILKAERVAKDISLSVNYDRCKNDELASKLSAIFHKNENSIDCVTKMLNDYGIGFAVVNKEEHASIDGYSFIKNGHPYIIITNRYKRIDNFAFTVMHELGHIYLGHTNENEPMISLDERSFEYEDENEISDKEFTADEYATNWLIPKKTWCLTPKVPINPFVIQKVFTEWAKEKHLNEWIVLGRVSHETGMYRFKSNTNRNIN